MYLRLTTQTIGSYYLPLKPEEVKRYKINPCSVIDNIMVRIRPNHDDEWRKATMYAKAGMRLVADIPPIVYRSDRQCYITLDNPHGCDTQLLWRQDGFPYLM